MNIFILGGSGFVGTRLTTLLLKNHEVAIGDIVRSESYPELWCYCDIRKKQNLIDALEDFDFVINLAAEHRDNVTPKKLYDEVNVEGSRLLCEVASELGIKKIIFTSSVAIYGFPETPLDESGVPNYFNDYGRTKWLAEEEYRRWKLADADNRLTIIRPTVIFGEENRGNVYNLFKQIASGKFLMIGHGQNKKSMAYVGNVCAFIEYLVQQDYFDETFNYVDKPDYNMKDLVELVTLILNRKLILPFSLPTWIAYAGSSIFDHLSKLTGKDFPFSKVRIKKFESQTVFDASKMLESGFEPPYSMPKALERTIKYEFFD